MVDTTRLEDRRRPLSGIQSTTTVRGYCDEEESKGENNNHSLFCKQLKHNTLTRQQPPESTVPVAIRWMQYISSYRDAVVRDFFPRLFDAVENRCGKHIIPVSTCWREQENIPETNVMRFCLQSEYLAAVTIVPLHSGLLCEV